MSTAKCDFLFNRFQSRSTPALPRLLMHMRYTSHLANAVDSLLLYRRAVTAATRKCQVQDLICNSFQSATQNPNIVHQYTIICYTLHTLHTCTRHFTQKDDLHSSESLPGQSQAHTNQERSTFKGKLKSCDLPTANLQFLIAATHATPPEMLWPEQAQTKSEVLNASQQAA